MEVIASFADVLTARKRQENFIIALQLKRKKFTIDFLRDCWNIPRFDSGARISKKRKGKEVIYMSEKELERLYDLLEIVKDPDTAAALRHAIFILESMR